MNLTYLHTPVGRLTIVGSDAGPRAVLWPNETPDGRLGFSEPVTVGSIPILDAASDQLHEYFGGSRRRFDLPLDLVGTAFQIKAWRALATIPYGGTVSYGQQAALVGHPSAARAVGAANGRNPVSIVLPCHRVIGKDGALSGFGGGIAIKRWLLDHEAANRDVADLRFPM